MSSTSHEKSATPHATSVPTFLTVAEYAATMRLSVATVRRRLDDGEIPYFQPGGKRTSIRIPSSALSLSSQPPADAAAPTISEDLPKHSHRRPNWQRRIQKESVNATPK